SCVALILSQAATGVALHAYRGAAPSLRYLSIYHVEAGLPFVQSDLEVGSRCISSEVDSPPLYVEDAVGCCTLGECEDAAAHSSIGGASCPCLVCTQVVPVGHDGEVEGGGGEGAGVGEEVGVGDELHVPVGREV